MQAQFWPARDLILYCMVALSGIIVLLLGRIGLMSLFPSLVTVPSFVPFLLLLEYAILLGPLFIMLSRENRGPHTTKIPFRWPGWKQAILVPLLAWIAFILIISGLVQLANNNIPGITGESTSIANLPQTWLATVLLTTTAGIIAPVAEEIIFRGVFLPAFLQWMPPFVAITLSALIFALVHGTGGVFLMLALIGGIAGYLSWKNNSIWPAIVFHLINNLAAIIADYATRGML